MPENKLLIQIAQNLATNTEATRNIEKHLETLNGKVIKLESRTQAVEGATALTTTAVAEIQQSRKENKTNWEHFLSKAGWAIVSLTAISIWQLIKYLINTDALKHIIK